MCACVCLFEKRTKYKTKLQWHSSTTTTFVGKKTRKLFQPSDDKFHSNSRITTFQTTRCCLAIIGSRGIIDDTPDWLSLPIWPDSVYSHENKRTLTDLLFTLWRSSFSLKSPSLSAIHFLRLSSIFSCSWRSSFSTSRRLLLFLVS